MKEKFRKKPVIIEAEQYWPFDGELPEDVVKFQNAMTEKEICGHCGFNFIDHGWLNTLEGRMTVCPGDMVITGVRGEKYACKPDIFAMTYEKVE
jgi:hypothetical protein